MKNVCNIITKYYKYMDKIMEELIVEEKINKTNEYYEEQGVYLELNKGRLSKLINNFEALQKINSFIFLGVKF